MPPLCMIKGCHDPSVARVHIFRPNRETWYLCREHKDQAMRLEAWRPRVAEEWGGLDDADPEATERWRLAQLRAARPGDPPPECAWRGCEDDALSTTRRFCRRCTARVRSLHNDPKAAFVGKLWRAGAVVTEEDARVLAREWAAREARTANRKREKG